MANQEARQSPAVFYGYIIVLATFIIAAVVEGLLYSFGVFFKPLLNEFGWTRAMTSGASSLSSILRVPLVIAVGRLSDRFGPRQLLAACGFFLGLGYLLMSQTNTIWQLYLFYGVIVSIGMSLYWIPLISLVPRWFARRRALMMGIVTSGIGVGQLIIPPLANWLISAYSWRISFLIIGGMSMGIIIISAQFLRGDPNQIGQLPYGENEAKQEVLAAEAREFSVREAIRTKQFWMLCVIFIPWIFCLSVVMIHMVIHAIGLGMSPASAANILAIIGIAGIIGRLALGRLADVIGIKPVLIISFVLYSIAFLWLLIARETWMLFLFAVIFGISYATFETLHSPIIAELFGLSSLGAISGVIFATSSIGFTFGPVIAGYIFDVTGSYQRAFLICAVMTFISLTSAVLLPLTRGKGEQAG